MAWLRARYADPVTWREVGYAVLLATVAPVLSAAALFAVPLAAVLIAGPFLVLAQQPGSSPVALVFGTVATVGQAVPYAIVGVLVLPLLPYLLTLVAGGQAAVARALLVDGPADELRAELTEVSRSRARLADAFEAERRRIERDLHDGAQQRLVSLTMQLGLARLDLPPGSPAASAVAAAHEQAKQLMAELRELIHGIQPQVLTDLGLPAAIGELADAAPIPVSVRADLAGRLPAPGREHGLLRGGRGADQHRQAQRRAAGASVTARQQTACWSWRSRDNGRGGAGPARGTGLTGLADRVAVAGGRMLLSSPDGGPTVLRVEVPCAEEPAGSHRRPVIRVVLAEDGVLLREGLAGLLERFGFHVVAIVGDAGALRAAVAEHSPDLVITDIRMPPGFTDEGLRAAVELRRARPGLPVVALSQYVQHSYAADLLDSGDGRGVGYLLKDRVVDVAEFVAALRRVAAGGTVVDPEVVRQLMRRRRDPLTALSASGARGAGAGGRGPLQRRDRPRLVVSEAAVGKHIGNILAKLRLPQTDDTNRRVLAVLAYLRSDEPGP